MKWWWRLRLHSKKEKTRKYAAWHLAFIKDAGAVKAPGRRLSDDPCKDVRAAAALGEVGDAREVESLRMALRTASPALGKAAVEALGKIGGSAAAEALAEGLKNPNPDVRSKAVSALGRVGKADDARPAATESLKPALADERLEIRSHASALLESFGWVPADEDERALFAVARERWDEAVGCGAAAVAPLMLALAEPDLERDWRVQSAWREAAKALGEIGDPRAVPALVEKLPLHGIGEVAADALVMMGGAAVGPLLEALERRPQVAGVLGRIGDRGAVESLVRALRRSPAPKGIVGALDAIDPCWRESEPGKSFTRRCVDDLSRGDFRNRQQAAALLAALGWRPEDATQRAWLAMLGQMWHEVPTLGDAAVGPLAASLDAGFARWGSMKTGGVINKAEEALRSVVNRGNCGPLLEVLETGSDYARYAAAGLLFDQVGWEPSDDTQRAWHAATHGRWDASLNEQAAVIVGPLAAVVKELEHERPVEVLRELLRQSAAFVPDETLFLLATLRDFRVGTSAGVEHYTKDTRSDYDLDPGYNIIWEYRDVSCEDVRGLARAEIDRRGLGHAFAEFTRNLK